jgi:DNA-binding XRE family transcriptional regulator
MEDLIQEVRETRKLPKPHVARLIRLSAGVTQERLAREVGVHRVTLARWEAGECQPRGEVRVKYARILAALKDEMSAA